MKFAFACSFVMVVAVSGYDWETYKQEFGKKYNSDEEHEHRRGLFHKNLAAYAALNAREPLANYGPTVFSDMHRDEYLRGYKPSTVEIQELEVVTSSQIPTSRDWTGKFTTAIKDQEGCGSCWAQSAIEQIESDAMREHGWTGVLSAQELVDCTSDGQGSFRDGCDGGSPAAGYGVLQALGGVASGYDYRSINKDGICKANDYKKYVKVESYKSVGKRNEAAMKSYVGSTGPLSVCVDASEWGGYKGGIKTSCGTSIDHCVQIVGYGIDGSTEYWKVRNSWDSSFGESGFIRLKMGSDLCKISSSPTATSTSVSGPAPVPSPSPTCSDQPLDWKSSEGDPCSLFALNSYCTPNRTEGEGWNQCSWGPISDVASGGISPLDACCVCGGGTAPKPKPSPAPSPSATCSDSPSNWKSSEGDPCCTYQFNRYCTPDGGEGVGWNHADWGSITDYPNSNGVSALDACCACGGGSKAVVV